MIQWRTQKIWRESAVVPGYGRYAEWSPILGEYVCHEMRGGQRVSRKKRDDYEEPILSFPDEAAARRWVDAFEEP